MIAGDTVPDFTLYDHTGRSRHLTTLLSEGPVVLFFYPLASSPICTAQACRFRDLGNEFGTLGAQRVGISTNSVDRQAHFAEQRAFDFPLLSDPGGLVAEQFGVRRGVRSRLGRGRADPQGARHVRHRGLLARILPTRRTTFVIETDGTVLKVIASELRASVHADLALWCLRNRVIRASDPPPSRGRHRRPEIPAQRTGGTGPPADRRPEPSH